MGAGLIGGTCSGTAGAFSAYPELRQGGGTDTFLVYPPLGSYVVEATCPAFSGAFGAAKDFKFTLRRGVDRIPIPTQSFDETLMLPGPRHMALTWSGTLTVIPE